MLVSTLALVSASVAVVSAHPRALPTSNGRGGKAVHVSYASKRSILARQSTEEGGYGACADACADFDKTTSSCDALATDSDSKMDTEGYKCACTNEIFSALIKCGECPDMTNYYNYYTGGLKGFVEKTVQECSTMGFPVTVDTSSIPGSTGNYTVPAEEDGDNSREVALQKCMADMYSVCSPEQLNNLDQSCICTQKFLDSTASFTQCASDDERVNEMASAMSLQYGELISNCTSSGYAGLTTPSAVTGAANSASSSISDIDSTKAASSASSSASSASSSASSAASSASAAENTGAAAGNMAQLHFGAVASAGLFLSAVFLVV